MVFLCEIWSRPFGKVLFRLPVSMNTVRGSEETGRLAIYSQRTVDNMKTEDYLVGNSKEQPSSRKSFACSYCNKLFTLVNNMKRHVKMKHLPPGQRLLVCHRCKFKTFDADSLTAHKAWHAVQVVPGCETPGKPYQCYHCGSKFVSIYSVRKHIVSRHPTDQIFRCEYCPYVNGLKYRFLEHLATHRDKCKPKYPSLILNCDICGATTTKSYLPKHIRICHSGTPAPYVCSLCDFKTWFTRDFQYHSYIHTGERPFVCYHCGHTAKRKSHIRMHIDSCSKKKRFSCPFCNFKSRFQSQWRKHISQCHQGLTPKNAKLTKGQKSSNSEEPSNLMFEFVALKEETDDVKIEYIDWEY